MVGKMVWLAALLLVGCDDKGAATPAARDTGSACAEPEATWENVRDVVLLPSCGFSSCHGDSAQGGLAIEVDSTADVLVGVMSQQRTDLELVSAGDPAASYLVWKIEGHADIERDAMPPPVGGLCDEHIRLIKAWITEL